MPSIQAKLLQFILKHARIKRAVDDALDAQGVKVASAMPSASMARKFAIDISESCGRRVYTVKTKTGQALRHIFYLHGGAYVLGFSPLHWSLIARLVQDTGCVVVAPDYPLAPRHDYVDTLGMVTPIYRNLVDMAGSGNIILMGDSAGAGLALALAQKMQADGVPSPEQIILLSPWLDLALENKEIAALESKDHVLDVKSLRRAGRAYAGGETLANPLLSPINGNMRGIGAISVFVGTIDVMLPDSRKLKYMAKQQGVAINLVEYLDMPHVWMLFNMPESQSAVKQLVGLINRAL